MVILYNTKKEKSIPFSKKLIKIGKKIKKFQIKEQNPKKLFHSRSICDKMIRRKEKRFDMSFFTKLFTSRKNSKSYSKRLEQAKALHGQPVKYVTERKADNEDVIGRGGAMAVHGDTFVVDSSGDRLFVCNISELEVSTLMSGDGAIISGPNLLEDGKHRSIIVHFVYHRK